MASRTQLSGPLILALALFFGFMMIDVQFTPLPLITFISFPLIAIAVLVLIAIRFRW